MSDQLKLFPKPLSAVYRVLPGHVFVHPKTGEHISEGVDFKAEDQDVEPQIFKLKRRPLFHRANRAILEPVEARHG